MREERERKRERERRREREGERGAGRERGGGRERERPICQPFLPQSNNQTQTTTFSTSVVPEPQHIAFHLAHTAVHSAPAPTLRPRGRALRGIKGLSGTECTDPRLFAFDFGRSLFGAGIGLMTLGPFTLVPRYCMPYAHPAVCPVHALLYVLHTQVYALRSPFCTPYVHRRSADCRPYAHPAVGPTHILLLLRPTHPTV